MRSIEPGISRFRVWSFGPSRNDSQDSAGRTFGSGPCFGPQRVRITLAQDSTPSTTMEAAASEKKFCAVALCVDSHQPPVAMGKLL